MPKLTQLIMPMLCIVSIFGAARLSFGAQHHVDLLFGKGPVCDQVRKQLRLDRSVYQHAAYERFARSSLTWPFWYSYENNRSKKPERPTYVWPVWHSAGLVTALNGYADGMQVSEFDFDNDHKIDRVSIYYFSTNYHLGTDLLVESGRSSSHLDILPVSEQTILGSNGSTLFPCQWDRTKITLLNCPELSQEHDNAGFTLTGLDRQRFKTTVRFRSRYTIVHPIQLESASGMMQTFMVLTGLTLPVNNGAPHEFVGVIKPLPEKKFTPMCLFRTNQP